MPNNYDQCNSLSKLAIFLIKSKQYSEANKIAEKLEGLSITLYEHNKARPQSALANIYLKLNNIEKAKAAHQSAMGICKKMIQQEQDADVKWGLISNLTTAVVEKFKAFPIPQEVTDCIALAQSLSRQATSPVMVERFIESIVNLYVAIGDFENAKTQAKSISLPWLRTDAFVAIAKVQAAAEGKETIAELITSLSDEPSAEKLKCLEKLALALTVVGDVKGAVDLMNEWAPTGPIRAEVLNAIVQESNRQL
jgi:tetratricopeptide (TPR) repeat protein